MPIAFFGADVIMVRYPLRSEYWGSRGCAATLPSPPVVYISMLASSTVAMQKAHAATLSAKHVWRDYAWRVIPTGSPMLQVRCGEYAGVPYRDVAARWNQDYGMTECSQSEPDQVVPGSQHLFGGSIGAEGQGG